MMITPSFDFYYNLSVIIWNPGYLLITSPPTTTIKRFLLNSIPSSSSTTTTIVSSLLILLPLTIKSPINQLQPKLIENHHQLILTQQQFTSSSLSPESSISVKKSLSSSYRERGNNNNHHHHHLHLHHHPETNLIDKISSISLLSNFSNFSLRWLTKPITIIMADYSSALSSVNAVAASAAMAAFTSSISSSFPGAGISNSNSIGNGSPITRVTSSVLNSSDSGYGSPSDTLITWQEVTILLLKIISCGSIILMAIFGNLLIIISVYRHQRLRITTNYFVVSLACADILVALFAMTFKASVAITGRWFLGKLVCDFWNSCDVLFSTASIMHLCCISVDRYYAIIKPLDYPMKITNRAVAIMLAVVWISSTLISFVPIFTGLYTTSEHMIYQQSHPDECSFKVNLPYSLISSSVSFWIPCTVMLFTYWRIYVEATKQEKMLYKHTQMIPKVQQTHHHHHHHHHHKHHYNTSSSHHSQQQQQLHTQTTNYSTGPSVGGGGTTNNNNTANNNNNKDNNIVTCGIGTNPCATTTTTAAAAAAVATTTTTATATTTLTNTNDTGNGSSSSGSHITVHAPPHRNSHGDDTESGQSTPTKRCINKMKREHKAAKTLGIIMGAFIACWLPFFVTYVTLSVCGDSCVDFPDIVVDTLFWVGYFNSAINPVIYAYFNREFREAFKETIQNVFCCCLQVECLQGPRNNSSIHFNCTYRSTQDIGLVENKYVKD